MTFLASTHNLGYQHPAIMTATSAQMEKTGVGRLRGIHPTLIMFAERLKEIAETQELIDNVRGKGLLIRIELVKNSKTKRPTWKEAARTVTEAFKKGFLIQGMGPYRQVLRLIPPLILTKEEAETAITIIENALREAEYHVR